MSHNRVRTSVRFVSSLAVFHLKLIPLSNHADRKIIGLAAVRGNVQREEIVTIHIIQLRKML